MKTYFSTALTAGLFALVLVGCQPSEPPETTDVVETPEDVMATHEQAMSFLGVFHNVQRLSRDSNWAYSEYPQSCYISGSENVIKIAQDVVNKSLIARWDGQLQTLSQQDKAFIEAVTWQEEFLAAYQRSYREYHNTYVDLKKVDDNIYEFGELYTSDEAEEFSKRGRDAMKKHQSYVDELKACKPYNNLVRAAIDVYEAQNKLQ